MVFRRAMKIYTKPSASQPAALTCAPQSSTTDWMPESWEDTSSTMRPQLKSATRRKTTVMLMLLPMSLRREFSKQTTDAGGQTMSRSTSQARCAWRTVALFPQTSSSAVPWDSLLVGQTKPLLLCRGSFQKKNFRWGLAVCTAVRWWLLLAIEVSGWWV